MLSYITALFIDNLDDYIHDDDSEALNAIKYEIAKSAIEEFTQFGYSELEEQITAFLESDEYDSDFEEDVE